MVAAKKKTKNLEHENKGTRSSSTKANKTSSESKKWKRHYLHHSKKEHEFAELKWTLWGTDSRSGRMQVGCHINLWNVKSKQCRDLGDTTRTHIHGLSKVRGVYFSHLVMTRCSSTIRTTISPTSRKPRTSTLNNSVFPHCLNPLFCTFLIGDFVLQRESKESMQAGNRCQTERNRRKRSFCDQCCKVDVKEKSRRNSIGSYSLQTHTKSSSEESQKILFWRVSEKSILLIKISEDTWNDELNKLFLVKIQFREIIISEWENHGNPEFGAKKFKTRIIRVTAWARISKTTIIGS